MTNLAMQVPDAHFVNGNPIQGPFEAHLEQAVFGMGCFWGAERKFWETEGVWTTAVGYEGGTTEHPTYQEVCAGDTLHAEVVLVVFDPQRISYEELLTVFWENHNPTQGMRQGNDIGTQYRSVIYTLNDEQQAKAQASLDQYQDRLRERPGMILLRLRLIATAHSITPRSITSSTWQKIRAAIAVWVALA